MHLGIPALLEFYKEHKQEDSLVLATIVAVEGSTYRKPGAMMLVSRKGCFAGMISGGCLEGDLLHHADEVFADGKARSLTYDMNADDELVWGLGLGCDGVIHLGLQRLDRSCNFGFLHSLEKTHGAGRSCLLALAMNDAADFALLDDSGQSSGNESMLKSLLAARSESVDWPGWRCRPGAEPDEVVINVAAPTRVLVCGAGPDAVPVVRLLCELDWQVTVADHRPAYARQERFPNGCEVIQVRPGKLSESAELAGTDAVIIMSHHLENDASYLSQVAAFSPAYIGALGPTARRHRLCEMAGVDAAWVHGPAGLNIGAELPEAIALSIVAEIHAQLNHRDGRPLTPHG